MAKLMGETSSQKTFMYGMMGSLTAGLLILLLQRVYPPAAPGNGTVSDRVRVIGDKAK